MTPEEEAQYRAGWQEHFARMKIVDEECARASGVPHWLYRAAPVLVLIGSLVGGAVFGVLIAGRL